MKQQFLYYVCACASGDIIRGFDSIEETRDYLVGIGSRGFYIQYSTEALELFKANCADHQEEF
jgi:hypothetical protein